MSKIIGTQEFMAAHQDHTLAISIVSLVEFAHSAIIEESLGSLIAVVQEKFSEQVLQDVGFYLHCVDCKVEEELNPNDVDLED